MPFTTNVTLEKGLAVGTVTVGFAEVVLAVVVDPLEEVVVLPLADMVDNRHNGF